MTSQGRRLAEAIRFIGVTEAGCHCWRNEFGGLKLDQVCRLKELELENSRLRKAVSDLTLDKLILTEALLGRQSAPCVAGRPWIAFAQGSECPSGGRATSWANPDRHSAVC